jgi:hypothetical protein
MPTANTRTALVLYNNGVLDFDQAAASSGTTKQEFEKIVNKIPQY